ncbi:MAG: DUF501 domain-containing protein [Actinomycetota bacterium]
MERPEQEPADERDRAMVAAQLGRAPRGRWRVVRRCHLGVPMVVENHPRLEDGSPFPTLFWLTCPLLIKRASRLESDGYMNDVSARLGEEEELRARLESALLRYKDRRDSHEVIDASARPGGGPERVKCLHAHLAHELADGPNPVGALTLAQTGWPDCRTPCVPDSGA